MYPPPPAVSVGVAAPLASTATENLAPDPVPPVAVITKVPAVLPAVFPALAAPSNAEAEPVGVPATVN